MNKPKLTSTEKKQMKILDNRLGMSTYVKKQVEKQQQLLSDYLKKKLKKLGYEFQSDKEFFQFLKERVTRVSYIDQKYDLYLDQTNEDKGTYIGGYSEATKTETVGSNTTITKNIKFN